MTIWAPEDDGFADLGSHDAFANGAPYNTFARLRREDPCHWSDFAQGKGYWSITRHEDIVAMIRDTETFSSSRGIRMEDQTEEEYLARRTFQETDGEEHRKVRMKVAKAFSPGVVAGFEDQIRDLCGPILDRALEHQSFDATREIARELPMRMLGQILGTPEEDLPWLVEKGDALMANTDPDFTDHVADKLDTDAYRLMPFNSPAGAELYEYAHDLMAQKNASGDTDGILHLILQPDENGETISESEFRNFFCLLVAAGNDTTRYSIAAGIQALARQPGLLEQMRSGEVWGTAADEIVRWASPASYFRRTAMRDVEVHGKQIREGDKVLYWFLSANRDEDMFEDPYRLTLSRKPNRQLGWGQGGPHVCLGMHLARLEIRVLFEELVPRIASIKPDGEEAFVRSNFVNGIKRLPVRVTLN
ncbi:cytochrome P450 [Ponticoccus sp. SC2-23]|uniref:cytochrome P450 n=1 Tax=Alexandriicola marinus TaxID=2081710 RepID=UPI000FDAADAD|nr:cytochrome P450 [Alexandriicola marinus]MBM1220933.1 cytochrome P450 [Ponticoccus sp. SC6-9]MBM1225503.1 cytochrome P450 [Ponticoccus sp. SC6-15]MBM1227686.1 cytochrome P450 [Ponticoccus sp. SC6-38]MBM1234676.1 cytochrome P450 [Ponticoccus sp. SC6-45]MBM1238188.1 cytochrome P450 [Ponticoccus sp. SC6-49]MBM1244179.1 cytochrome P450 [Ponticoccus sp. SC2-64]MBM1248200.1 cytochrome P450 [Ponticoccus sp. SC6-42]MBM1252588.1 cytochrome P450 [Ponticoccus sp. SC6-33]MBM1256197.1 cytochrome P450